MLPPNCGGLPIGEGTASGNSTQPQGGAPVYRTAMHTLPWREPETAWDLACGAAGQGAAWEAQLVNVVGSLSQGGMSTGG